MDRLAVLAAACATLADRVGLPADAEVIPLLAHLDPAVGAAVPIDAGPDHLGMLADSGHPAPGRRARGSFYTPPHIAARVTAEVLGALTGDPHAWRILDPAAGGGVFLLAAARELVARGVPARFAVERCVCGIDSDPVAVLVAQASLVLFGWDGSGPAPRPDVSLADALLTTSVQSERGFDAVLGNPPFLNQLGTATARPPERAARLRAALGDAATGYADTAYLFLALARRLTRPCGAFGMILPESLLAARDAGAVRAELAEHCSLRWIWRSSAQVFPAEVRVCAPVFVNEPSGAGQRVRRATGPDFAPLPLADGLDRDASTWSRLFADSVPVADPAGARTVGDLAVATADFRDQFYGLIPYVYDADDETPSCRLITVGLVDPARSLWGRRPTRFAGTTFRRPAVDVAALRDDPRLGGWAQARLVPKLLVATQSRVLEIFVDERGDHLPSTPVVTVTADPDRLWHVAAALGSPVLTAWALRNYAGAALAPDAIKLSARQIAGLPLPDDSADWDAAAASFRAASAAEDEMTWRRALEASARAACHAYRITDAEQLMAWWTARLPAWDRRRPARRDQVKSGPLAPSRA